MRASPAERLKALSSVRYQASDGVTYALQRVDSAASMIAQGSVLNLLAGVDRAASEEEQAMAVARALLANPEESVKRLTAGEEDHLRRLRDGLIGEVLDDGQLLVYHHVDKPAPLLVNNEWNVRLMPDALRRELLAEINRIGVPPVEAGDVKAFPGG